MKKYSFNTAYTQARDLYGVEMTQDDFENLGMIAWGRIGNNYYKLYRYYSEAQQDENKEYFIELPCNVDVIEAVTASYEEYQKTSSTESYGFVTSSYGEEFIESRKHNTSSLYAPGKFVKYTLVDNRIYIDKFTGPICILYKGFIVDEDGLPSLNSKEIDAIAVFCAYTKMYKKAVITTNGNLMQIAMTLKADWKNLCTQARVPEYINQNEMDEILNASTSWDRKRFGKSFKPFR